MINYVLTGGWSINAGVLTIAGDGSAAVDDAVILAGREYGIEFEVVGAFDPGGFVRIKLGDEIVAVTSVGIKKLFVTPVSDALGFTILSSTFNGTLSPATGQEFFAAVPNTEGTLQDAILFVTGGPTIAGGLSVWFSKTGSESLLGAERRWLIEQGATPRSNNDMWYQLLRVTYSGSIGDMKKAYWNAGGVF